ALPIWELAEDGERAQRLAVPVEQRLVVPGVRQRAGVIVVALPGLRPPMGAVDGEPGGLPPDETSAAAVGDREHDIAQVPEECGLPCDGGRRAAGLPLCGAERVPETGPVL